MLPLHLSTSLSSRISNSSLSLLTALWMFWNKKWKKGILVWSSHLRGLWVITTPLLNSSNGLFRSAVLLLLNNLIKLPCRSWNLKEQFLKKLEPSWIVRPDLVVVVSSVVRANEASLHESGGRGNGNSGLGCQWHCCTCCSCCRLEKVSSMSEWSLISPVCLCLWCCCVCCWRWDGWGGSLLLPLLLQHCSGRLSGSWVRRFKSGLVSIRFQWMLSSMDDNGRSLLPCLLHAVVHQRNLANIFLMNFANANWKL